MICYARLSAKKERCLLLRQFMEIGAHVEEIYIDDSIRQKDNGTEYARIRSIVLSSKQIFVIDSLSSLGKNAKEIAKELSLYSANGVRLVVLDIPSTAESKIEPISLLSEVFTYLAAGEIARLKEGQSAGIQAAKEHGRPYGRKKIPFPNNWEENYERWKAKEITAVEFQKVCNLKKGTFYHLLKEAQQNDNMAAMNSSKEA